jgi:rubrerythrin
MARLTLEQAIRNAIEAEKSAARFYRLLGESTGDAEARAFLERMVKEEEAHAAAIQDMGRKLTSGEIPGQADDNVECIETMPAWAYSDDISFDQALEIALDAENHAALYYSAISDGFEGKVAEFFGNLAKTEEQHVKNLEGMIEKKHGL